MRKSRWREIAEQLQADIVKGVYKPGDRLPSSEAAATTYGVSRLTTHKAIEELQRKGLVERNGRAGTVVKDLTRKNTRRIAFVVDQIDFEYSFPQPRLLAGIHQGLETDYDLVICDAKADADREIELLRRMAKECDGILCWPMDNSAAGPVMNELMALGTHIVQIDRIAEGSKAPSVVVESTRSTREATNFLIKRGHKRIGLLTFNKPKVSTIVERCAAFESSLAEHGLDSNQVRYFPAEIELSDRPFLNQVICDALFVLTHGPNPVTAVFCAQDLIGSAVLATLGNLELPDPQKFEIVTFNDWPTQWFVNPWNAHRISVNPLDLGATAISLLRDLIAGLSPDPIHAQVEASFVDADRLLARSQH
jgi:GntR family transcriptional regulator, arabinose operon transcriptional repressor